MATNEQESNILKVVVGLFNAAPGQNNMAELVEIVDAGTTVEQLANILEVHPLFVNSIIGNTTPTQQVAILMNHFGVVADGNPTSAGSEAEAFFTDQIGAGVGFGAIVHQAITFLSADSLPAKYTEAATLLENKALVSATYSNSFSSGELGILQAQLAGLSGTELLTQAEADAIIARNNESVAVTGDVIGVDGTAEIFFFANDATGDSTITGLTVTEDSLQFDLDPAADFTTLDQLNGFVLADGDVVAVQQNQISDSTFINFGIDEATGNTITLNLVGVADPSTVAITIV